MPISKFMQDRKAERAANSQFKEGTVVALVNTHWGRRIDGKYVVGKVRKDGNFTLAPKGRLASEYQYRPSQDGTRAERTGERGFRATEHLEPWSPAIEAEIADRKLLRRLEARRDACIEALKERRGDELRNMARAFDTLEELLGLAQHSPQPDDSMDSSG